LKRLSIFFVFIFFVSILSVNYHPYENRVFQDNPLIFDSADENLNFLTCNIYQVHLTFRFIYITIITKILFKPHILVSEFLIRAPPV
jgi:hypothetical protein